MALKQPVQYEKVNVSEESVENEEQTHPTEAPSFCVKCLHYMFHIWVFQLISICQKATLQIEDTPALPKHMRVAETYKNWMKIFQERKSKNLSTATLSMIYHTQKGRIIISAILHGVKGFAIIYLSYMIVRHHIYPEMIDIVFALDYGHDNDKLKLVWDVSKYAVLLFVCAIIGDFFRAFACHLDSQTATRVIGCLQYQCYNKLLSLDMNEPNKQQLLNIVGSEISALYVQLEGFMSATVICLYLLIILEILLYKIVGSASFFGIIFMLFICLPFQLFAGLSYAQNQAERLNDSAKRVQLISQLLSGIRFLKCNGSETALMKRINEYRLNELGFVKNINISVAIMFLLNMLIPSLMTFVVLMFYTFVFKNSVTILTVVSLVMTMALAGNLASLLPLSIAGISQIVTTATRIDEFLNKKQKIIDVSERKESQQYMLEINDAFFEWNSAKTSDNFVLKNICLKIGKGKLVAVIGTVGSGKSSLIQSILGEMNCSKGSIDVNISNGCGYCSQTAYIQNATFRDNITMDLEFNEPRYKQCIFAADLISDLKQLPFGDMTEIGSEGINLSGGQKMRLCFARTLYRKDEYDLFLFDDPLSSVDIYVGKHMFFNGVLRYLKLRQSNKTCLMTINSHLYLLKYFDEVIIVDNGEIQLHTETAKLLNDSQNNNLYQKYAHLLPETADENNDEKIDINAEEIDFDINADENGLQNIGHNYFNEQSQLILPSLKVYKEILNYSLMNVDSEFEQEYYDDSRAEIKYSKFKLALMILILLILFAFSCLLIFCNVWLVIWRENVDEIPISKVNLIDIDNKSDLWYFSVWFSLLAVIACMTYILFSYIGNVILLKASHSIFAKTLLNILKCNTLFFDIIPRGQLLNVLSSDPNTMDSNVPIAIFCTVMIWSTMVGLIVMISIVTPSILIFIAIFAVPICYLMFRKIQKTYYSLSTLWKISLSPILALYEESITGLDSIRAYKLEKHFLSVIRHRIDTASQCKYNARSTIAWSELYINAFLDFCVFVSIVYFCLRLVYYNPEQDLNLLMLSVWWYSSIGQIFVAGLFVGTETDSHVSSIQKMFFYCHSDENIDGIYKSKKQKGLYFTEKWPKSGNLNIQKLKLKYRENFDIVLNIEQEIDIKQGTKLAIVGRTGSGKSSMLVSIFRLFEPCIGSNVTIDKLNIYQLGLFDIRSKISIITQTPIMFSGSLRFNLDPFNEHSDDEIWNALKDVQLYELINNRENKLYCDVGENGSAFSVGEAQLICFGRAILKDSKILFMDEPTSSIDKATDKIMQELIRSERFEDITVICIAHRLQTILDYDCILLLENGEIIEYDSPNNLIADKTSKFNKLLHLSNLCYK